MEELAQLVEGFEMKSSETELREIAGGLQKYKVECRKWHSSF
jgi:hypothetical protein